MFMPETWKQSKYSTIELGPLIASRLSPLDEVLLLYEQILIELVDAELIHDEGGTIILGSTWPS